MAFTVVTLTVMSFTVCSTFMAAFLAFSTFAVFALSAVLAFSTSAVLALSVFALAMLTFSALAAAEEFIITSAIAVTGAVTITITVTVTSKEVTIGTVKVTATVALINRGLRNVGQIEELNILLGSGKELLIDIIEFLSSHVLVVPLVLSSTLSLRVILLASPCTAHWFFLT
jgi:hypothetical protein